MRRAAGLPGVIACAVAVLVSAGCARESYRAKPLDVEAGVIAHDTRTLDAPALREYFEAQGVATSPWPRTAWDLEALGRAAVFHHPEIELARARARLAAAEKVTGGARLPISVTARPEYNAKSGAGETPWGFGVLVGLPIDIGGKREALVEQLGAQEEAAWVEVGVASWRVRSRLRRHFVDLYIAGRTLAILEREQAERRTLLALVEKREAVGYAASVDTSLLRLRLAEGDVALKRAGARREQSLASVAEAVGVPLEVLASVRLDFTVLEALQAPPTAEATRRAALLNRMDLRRKLSDYAAAEAAVKLEIARQYPDVTLVPGYFWDADESIWSIAFLGLLPPNARTRALIREAEARREVEEKSFLALQNAVIAESVGAAARYRLAWEAQEATHAQIAAADHRRHLVERQFEQGQADRVELVQARIDALVLERTAVVAQIEAQLGLSALEDALQRPLDNPDLAGAVLPSAAANPDAAINPALIDND
ncbi:MAG: TolC family protein [Burkholderiales bacterium]|nr:TolC family protein [Burkholderiales bacterium]